MVKVLRNQLFTISELGDQWFRNIQAGEQYGAKIKEIDGLRFNSSSGKIEEIISMKLNPVKHKPLDDTNKLSIFMRNIPDDGPELQTYIANNPIVNISSKKLLTIDKAEIIYTDLRTGKNFEIKPSIFRQSLKESYDHLTDFYKIDPVVFGSTRDDVIESAYQAFVKRYKNGN